MDGGRRTRSENTQVSARSLMNPDEIIQMAGDRMLLIMQGSPLLIASKGRYYDQAEFKGLEDAA